MSSYILEIKLLSDTTFGRGDGVAGLIDQEVEHDAMGCPFLRGRTLKGLITEECENLIATFPNSQKNRWQNVADNLFGTLGSTLDTLAAIHFGDARLPEDLRAALAYQVDQKAITTSEILNSLTNIRRQTSIDPISGAPDKGSLRTARVVIRDLVFRADLTFNQDPTDDMLSLLVLGTVALRRLGSCRNRGRGHVLCTLHNHEGKDISKKYLAAFEAEEVTP